MNPLFFKLWKWYKDHDGDASAHHTKYTDADVIDVLEDKELYFSSNNVGIGTDTPTAPLSIVDSDIGNIEPLIDLTSTSTQQYGWSFSSMITNMQNGWNNFFFLGKAKTVRNSGYFSYYHVADGSTLNSISFGLFGVDNIFNMTGAANVGISTKSPTAKLDINSDILRLRTAKTPSSASDTGNAGDICWDANYVYVCTATNTWKRSVISTW